MENQSFLIGVSDVYLAKISSDDQTGVVYETPFAVKGATEVAVTMNNSNTTIYADDGAYEVINQQGDVDVAISLAGLNGEKRAEVTGGTYDSRTVRWSMTEQACHVSMRLDIEDKKQTERIAISGL